MWREIFRFEIIYRLKRPETYLFFVFLFAFSIIGTDFIFQGVEIGLVKMNAPLVIGKTMGALTGIFLIIASMIMGIPMIRDDKYGITPLVYTNPISKLDLLLGRYLGSFVVLLIVFFGLPLGMMLGELMPWRLQEEMLPFNVLNYLLTYSVIVLPILFFGGSLFFVTGTLSRKLIVVYTQGIFVFVLFLLTKAVTNVYLQAVLDPFSLTTTTLLTKDWTVEEKNVLLLSFDGILLVNKVFWLSLGVLILWIGYRRFNFSTTYSKSESKKAVHQKGAVHEVHQLESSSLVIDYPATDHGLRSQVVQFRSMSWFYAKSLLKETSFWAIVICGVIIILINSVNLGTVYGVDSYPTTYFIVEELQEMSFYFFVIILLFYSGELYWKERSVGAHLIIEATHVSPMIILFSKVAGLIVIFVVLISSFILSGIVFQIVNGYYHFDLRVYIVGFFFEILPLLVIYTCAAFFFQALVNNKFLGILLTLVFCIVVFLFLAMGFDHPLISFGGSGLSTYSEMNGYGHFLKPFLLIKLYWLLFAFIMTVVGSAFSVRGVDAGIIKRIKKMKSRFDRRALISVSILLVPFVLLGGYLFYQMNVLNEIWSMEQQYSFRADYEKTLKKYEYIPQLTIIESELNMELYPHERSYDLSGIYVLKNEQAKAISEIHIQKQIKSEVVLGEVHFSKQVNVDSQFQEFEYIIYHLTEAVESGDSLIMSFSQQLKPQGIDISESVGSVFSNGTFIRNHEFPTLGYNRKYELSEDSDRERYELGPRHEKADQDHLDELNVARTGSDSHGVLNKVVIGTSVGQTAITSGNLIKEWKSQNRNYFEYQSTQPIINFYSILSAEYQMLQDQWSDNAEGNHRTVDLEIYHHPRHDYNLNRMMDAMKSSLAYYSNNFSAYQYDQLRIVEFPRYERFAQSFPNTIPFSESIGFMLNIDDSVHVDMTFFITAHEVAHQWWGMQVEAANVKGQDFILETLAQYSALMVFKNKYPEYRVTQFLEYQKERYEHGQDRSKKPEVPLSLVENQEHIYYNKGALVMYELYELIGEERINEALRSFIRDWNTESGVIKTKSHRYATSEDLVFYLLEVSPDSSRDDVERIVN